MLFLFVFNELLAEFISMIWIIIFHEYKSLTYKQDSRMDRMMLLYAMIAFLIQFVLHTLQITDFEIGNPPHYNRASSMLYRWYGKGVAALSPTLHRT